MAYFWYTSRVDIELGLTTVSRECLLGINSEQKATVAHLQLRMVALEPCLNTRESPGMPGNKPPSAQRPPMKIPFLSIPEGRAPIAWRFAIPDLQAKAQHAYSSD